MANKDLIPIGFLTAAYLLWFRQLGYSWVLQAHLDVVRDQIRNPTRSVLPKSCVALVNGRRFEKPWLGMGYIGGELALLAGLVNHVVFFPPADRPSFYEGLPPDLNGVKQRAFYVIRPQLEHSSQAPFGMFLGGRLLVAPAVFLRWPQSALLFHPDGKSAPVTMRPVSAEIYERAQRLPDAVPVRLGVVQSGAEVAAIYFVDRATVAVLDPSRAEGAG